LQNIGWRGTVNYEPPDQIWAIKIRWWMVRSEGRRIWDQGSRLGLSPLKRYEMRTSGSAIDGHDLNKRNWTPIARPGSNGHAHMSLSTIRSRWSQDQCPDVFSSPRRIHRFKVPTCFSDDTCPRASRSNTNKHGIDKINIIPNINTSWIIIICALLRDRGFENH
jgi:hypothetical protein